MKQINTTLYKKSAKGSVQQWSITAMQSPLQTGYMVIWGQVGGSLQTKHTTVTGKNLGKSNATTDHEQAIAEATAKWEKQLKKGYVEDPSGESDVKLPMKVISYYDKNNRDKVVFPCDISPKLNGVNGECRLLDDGTFVQLSRGGEHYPPPPEKAVQELTDCMNKLGVRSLNYEIYLHGEHLQDIQGAVKAPHKHPELWEKLEYHVFDLPDHGGDWSERSKALYNTYKDEFYNGRCWSFVKYVQVVLIRGTEDLMKYHNMYVENGFEGSVVRNLQGLYKYNTRSNDVFKVKDVMSEEFKIISYKVDKNNHPVFSCRSPTATGKIDLFSVKPKGTKEQRDSILAEVGQWLGKWMTVEFEMYSKDGLPQKPVGVGLRNGRELSDGTFEVME